MNQSILYIGTYSSPIMMGTGELYRGKGNGIHSLLFSQGKGTFFSAPSVIPSVNPSFLHFSANRKYLYTVNESDAQTSSITAYGIKDGGKLYLLNWCQTGGASPCHICTDRQNRLLFSANYGGGSISVFSLRKDGSLGIRTDLVQHHGHGTNPMRQEGPHVHHVFLDEDDTILYASDLGLDVVNAYNVDYSTGTLTLIPDLCLHIQPGRGPRSMAVNPSGTYLYLTTEMGCTCIVYKKSGLTWKPIQEISTVPKDISCSNITAEASLSPDGSFLYVSNRGHDSIGVFSISKENGSLTPIQWISTQGKTPRSFCMDSGGNWLIAANQDSDTLSVFSRDAASGKLNFLHQEYAATPVCVHMYDPVNKS